MGHCVAYGATSGTASMKKDCSTKAQALRSYSPKFLSAIWIASSYIF